MNEIPKCHLPECMSRDMKEIGGVGKDVHWSDMDGKNFGVSEVKLYQCEVCKNVVLT